MPIGNDFETYWTNLRRRRDRHPPDPVLRRVGVRGPDRRRGPRLRPDDVHGRQDGPPHEPVHPPRDGRRQGGGRAHRDRLRGDDRGRSATASASSSTPAAAGSRRSSTAPTSTTRRARASCPPFAVPALSGSMAACMLSMEYKLTGPVMTQVAACATSVIAFHDALRLIATGECDVVLTGGSEAPIVPMGVAALVEHDRAVEAQRRTRDRVAAVRPHPRRLRPRRGRRGRGRRVLASTRSSAARRRSPRSSAAR